MLGDTFLLSSDEKLLVKMAESLRDMVAPCLYTGHRYDALSQEMLYQIQTSEKQRLGEERIR